MKKLMIVLAAFVLLLTAAVAESKLDGLTREELLAMRDAHIAASIDVVAGSHYMVEHWGVAYALLLATEP